MLNKVILQANLTRDVELRYAPSGTAIAKVGLAVNNTYKDKDGNKRDDTLFIDGSVFGRSAEIVNQYLHKGSKVLVEGRLKLESWEKDGQKHHKHSVAIESFQFLDSKEAGSTQQAPTPQTRHEEQKSNGYQTQTVEIDDESIPF